MLLRLEIDKTRSDIYFLFFLAQFQFVLLINLQLCEKNETRHAFFVIQKFIKKLTFPQDLNEGSIYSPFFITWIL